MAFKNLFFDYYRTMFIHSRLIRWGFVCFAEVLCFSGVSHAEDALDPASVAITRDIEYAYVDGVSLKLDLYVPKNQPKPMPVVMWIHGGAWRMGDKNDTMPFPFVRAGFAVASVEYRFSQVAVFPAQIYDCKAAVRWVRRHAADYGFDPERIAASGASAGGHLAALLGTTGHPPELEGNEGSPNVSSAVQVVCDFYGPTNFTDWKMLPSINDLVTELLGGPISEKMDLARQASPLLYLNAQSAPCYIVQGDEDQVVPIAQSIEFDAALKKAGVPSALYILKGGGHGFRDPGAFQGAITFFHQYLQVPKK